MKYRIALPLVLGLAGLVLFGLSRRRDPPAHDAAQTPPAEAIALREEVRAMRGELDRLKVQSEVAWAQGEVAAPAAPPSMAAPSTSGARDPVPPAREKQRERVAALDALFANETIDALWSVGGRARHSRRSRGECPRHANRRRKMRYLHVSGSGQP